MSTIENPAVLEIFNVALEATRGGRLKWSEHPGNATSFMLPTPSSGGDLIISSRDSDDRPPIDFYVMSQGGAPVASIAFSTQGLTPVTTTDSDLIELYALAKASARGTDQILNAVLQDLRRAGAVEPAVDATEDARETAEPNARDY